jgi:hypothetical protein
MLTCGDVWQRHVIKALCWTEGGEMFAEEEDDDLREAEPQLRLLQRQLAQARSYSM